jgi:cyclopropane-fatty-acyl-phospholipid synthase
MTARQSVDFAPAARTPWPVRLVLALLRRIEQGTLDVVLPTGERHTFGQGAPHAELVLRDWNVFNDALKSGDVGFAEGYIAGRWQTNDLAALLTIFTRNRDAIERVVYGSAVGRLFYRLKHLLNANTKRGSRRNIAAHYDLGNDF